MVYKSTCAASDRAYIGQTARHLLVRIQEHEAENTTMSTHFKGCTGVVTLDDAETLDFTTNNKLLITMEALYIRCRKSELNTKDELQSNPLVCPLADRRHPNPHDIHFHLTARSCFYFIRFVKIFHSMALLFVLQTLCNLDTEDDRKASRKYIVFHIHHHI